MRSLRLLSRSSFNSLASSLGLGLRVTTFMINFHRLLSKTQIQMKHYNCKCVLGSY